MKYEQLHFLGLSNEGQLACTLHGQCSQFHLKAPVEQKSLNICLPLPWWGLSHDPLGWQSRYSNHYDVVQPELICTNIICIAAASERLLSRRPLVQDLEYYRITSTTTVNLALIFGGSVDGMLLFICFKHMFTLVKSLYKSLRMQHISNWPIAVPSHCSKSLD